MPLNCLLCEPLGRLSAREGLDGLLGAGLGLTVLVCSRFSSRSIRRSIELILARSRAIDSSLLRFGLVAPMIRNVMIRRTTTVAIDTGVFIVPFLSHLRTRHLEYISNERLTGAGSAAEPDLSKAYALNSIRPAKTIR